MQNRNFKLQIENFSAFKQVGKSFSFKFALSILQFKIFNGVLES